MFQKVRTLAVQANNGTNTTSDKQAISKEMSSLLTEVQRIAKQTTYGGKTILNGDASNSIYENAKAAAGGGGGGGGAVKQENGDMTFQVGANAGDTIKFTVENYNFSNVFSAADKASGNKFKDFYAADSAKTDALINFGNDKVVVSLTQTDAKKGSASDLITIMDHMIAQVDGTRANLGAMQNRLESSIRNQSNTSANEADARSRIRDADFAEESANLSQQSIIQQAATSMLMQANTRPQLGLSLLR